jgi:iron complex outermembrane receptor protein
MKRMILFMVCAMAISYVHAQHSISGTVTDNIGEKLTGAYVTLDANKSFITDANGRFEIPNLKNGNYSLKISFVGYETIIKDVAINNADIQSDVSLQPSTIMTGEVIVRGLRASDKDPVTKTTIAKQEYERGSLGQDLPILLQNQTSIVTTSDAGAGVGYTGIRVRGSDASRTNVTINGVPLNDAESEDVFWVDIPDFAENVDNIQIQRGVGTSTNGAGSFGASMNLLTTSMRSQAYAEAKSSAGSFGTYKNSFSAGSGLLDNHFTFDVRASLIKSNGYIDRAWSNLSSYYGAAGYYSSKDIIKFIAFGGNEQTYQAWNGIPKVKLNNDTAGMRQYIIDNGLIGNDSLNFLNSNPRRYNSFMYDNQTDNYQQNHYQLIYIRKINSELISNLTLHYTKGLGYYEEYKENASLADYNLSNVTIGGDTIASTNLIRRLWLNNDFYGAIYRLNYTNNGTDITFGALANEYFGWHYGQVIWAQFASEGPIRYEWYRNRGLKDEQSAYLKFNQQIGTDFNFYADLQERLIQYSIKGNDEDLNDLTQTHNNKFFNPKLGGRYTPIQNFSIYTSLGVAHKEPTQTDYTTTKPGFPQVKPEQLYDWETGLSLVQPKYTIHANCYLMYYNDQLVLTGALDNVGNPLMMNVPKSFRSGIELEGKIKLLPTLTWQVNVTVSENKIIQYTNYTEKYDANWNILPDSTSVLKNKTIAFSPSFVAGSNLSYNPFKVISVQLLSKYVGKQYVDNTKSDDKMLNAYFVNNLLLSYELPQKLCKSVELNVLVNNIFNTQYIANAWVAPYILDGKNKVWDGYFPQAGRNILAGITVKF